MNTIQVDLYSCKNCDNDLNKLTIFIGRVFV